MPLRVVAGPGAQGRPFKLVKSTQTGKIVAETARTTVSKERSDYRYYLQCFTRILHWSVQVEWCYGCYCLLSVPMWGHEDDEELVGVPDAACRLRDTGSALHALNNYCKVTVMQMVMHV